MINLYFFSHPTDGKLDGDGEGKKDKTPVICFQNVLMRLSLWLIVCIAFQTLTCTSLNIYTSQTPRHISTKLAGRKKEIVGLEERKAGEVFEIQESPFYRFNAKTVAMATQQSCCKRLSLSAPSCSARRLGIQAPANAERL